MSEIENFICKLNLISQKYDKLQNIINFKELTETLNELNELVEIYNVKNVILKHIEMLLILTLGKDNDIIVTDSHMLHTVFYGHPGVGKSRTAKILAKIWKAIGVLKNISHNSHLNYKDILIRINSIRDKYLTLYEIYSVPEHKDSRVLWKNYNQKWSTLKHELSDFADKVHTNVINKVYNVPQDELIVVAGREDFVAEYSGQTAIKTLNFLKSCIGKCVIVEEAYLLYHSDSDIYGMEALTVLNRFMDEFAAYIAIIFTGYENKLRDTIFKAQPGLKRRCQWIFNLKGYSCEGLCQIFLKQMNGLGWSFESNDFVYDFFKENFDKFGNFGGDTEKLALHCKMMYSHHTFNHIITSKETPNIDLVLTQKMLYEAFDNYNNHFLE